MFDGTAWRSISAPLLTTISCVTSTFCLGTGASGGRSVSSVFDGTVWSTPKAFGGPSDKAPVSLSCASTRLYVAIDKDGRAATYRGTGWSSFARVAGAGSLVAVSCPGRRPVWRWARGGVWSVSEARPGPASVTWSA